MIYNTYWNDNAFNSFANRASIVCDVVASVCSVFVFVLLLPSLLSTIRRLSTIVVVVVVGSVDNVDDVESISGNNVLPVLHIDSVLMVLKKSSSTFALLDIAHDVMITLSLDYSTISTGTWIKINECSTYYLKVATTLQCILKDSQFVAFLFYFRRLNQITWKWIFI